MKTTTFISITCVVMMSACQSKTKENTAVASTPASHLFMDVHNLEPGKVTMADVAGAHQKDLAVQGKYGVKFIKYWVDEKAGKVYCLAESADSAQMVNAHQEAHGLIPDFVREVMEGPEAAKTSGAMFMDVHYLGAGKVTAEDVAAAHKKDLSVQSRYGVNLINYWVDEKSGTVMCLAQAPDSAALVNTHKTANGDGLIPNEVHQVKEAN